jgi:hypothetical protein
MNAAISWGNKTIAPTEATAAHNRIVPSNRPRAVHCLARCCCQNPTPIKTTERPKSQGRNVVEKALAAPAPSAPANPSGRQQLSVATELTIAATDADTPAPCLTSYPLSHPPSPPGGPSPRAEVQSASLQDTTGNSARTSVSSAILPLHLAR